MKLMLLVSLKCQEIKNWSLADEMIGAAQNKILLPLQTDGVIPVGRDALLFDESVAHSSFVRVCAHLLSATPPWPYFVVPLEASSILVEGMCGEKLQAILDKLKVQDGQNAPRVS